MVAHLVCLQAATEVDAMQKELSEAKIVVERATLECNQLLEVGGSHTSCRPTL
jgi:dynein heavy chain